MRKNDNGWVSEREREGESERVREIVREGWDRVASFRTEVINLLF